MKKYGWKFVTLALFAGLVFMWLVKAPILSAYLSQKIRIPVSMGWVGLWPGRANIHAFKIKNPSGFVDRIAFQAKRIACDYQSRTLFQDLILIDQIELRGAHLYIDCSNALCSENNWTAIKANMPKNTSTKKVKIQKLIVTDFSVDIKGFGIRKGTQTKYFERMEFDNIDSDQGFPTSDLVNKIFQQAGLEQFIKDIINPLKEIPNILLPR